jgi:hypothetical protein
MDRARGGELGSGLSSGRGQRWEEIRQPAAPVPPSPWLDRERVGDVIAGYSFSPFSSKVVQEAGSN